MTRYPKSVPYIPPHNCYSEKLSFNLEKDQWECPICGEKYIPPGHCDYVFPPEEHPYFFKPFWINPPTLKGKCNGHGMALVPGDGVRLSSIKASVTVSWFPWKDYSKR